MQKFALITIFTLINSLILLQNLNNFVSFKTPVVERRLIQMKRPVAAPALLVLSSVIFMIESKTDQIIEMSRWRGRFTGNISQNPWVGKDMGIPIYFPRIGQKYSHTLGNLWKLVSDISELCGFFNSIDFYRKPTVWEYISFPHNILIVWNFALPILCGLFRFRNNF